MVTIFAENNEFAAASGSNIDVTPDYSYFDHPPNSTMDLVISSNDGDLTPKEFSVGDTYDLSWEGNGGGRSMEDATVIRSDYVGPDQGAIVFEGTDASTGEPFQLVWSPGFDLEQWYWDNGGGPSSSNAFYTSDQNAAATYKTVCFAAGTLIRTPKGERKIETLQAGDAVVTLDHGSQTVLWTRQTVHQLTTCGDDMAPILIKSDALGPKKPRHDLIVSPQHRILVGGRDQQERIFPFEAFVPAKALTGLRRIRHMRGLSHITWVHFACASHEIVSANGAWAETLLIGPETVSSLTRDERTHLSSVFPQNQVVRNGPVARPCLTVQSARKMITEVKRRRASPRLKRKASPPVPRAAAISHWHAF